MRVGDILLQRGWVQLERLASALAEQHATGLRICSLLMARNAITFDHASRALGEQLGVASALRKHLAHRDQALARLLPARIALAVIALPIGRLRNGSLIVCVRDPSAELGDKLARVLRETIVLAVAPARYLERLVEYTYTPRPAPTVKVEVKPESSGSMEIDIELELAAEDSPAGKTLDADVDVDDLMTEPSLPSLEARSTSRALPVAIRHIAPATQAPARDSLDGTIASFPDIDDVDWLFDVAMTYVASRWSASLLLTVRDDLATGMRGHGANLSTEAARAFSVPLAQRSIVRLAHEQRRLVHDPIDDGDAAHGALVALLGEARFPAAAPVLRGDQVVYVLVVGDPPHASDDPEDAAADLGFLVEAISEACDRIG